MYTTTYTLFVSALRPWVYNEYKVGMLQAQSAWEERSTLYYKTLDGTKENRNWMRVLESVEALQDGQAVLGPLSAGAFLHIF